MAFQAPADHLDAPLEVIHSTEELVLKVTTVSPATVLPQVIRQQPYSAFTVAVPTKGFTALGLKLEVTETRAPMVLKIEDGAIQEFNKVYQGSSIRPFDVLTALDDSQSWEAIERKMTTALPDKMFLSLKRPRKVQVQVDKRSKSLGILGMTLAYSDTSVGVVVRELDPKGFMTQWNAQNASDSLEVLDRIVEVDGKAYCGTEMAKVLEETDRTWRLTVLKYTPDEIPVLERVSCMSFWSAEKKRHSYASQTILIARFWMLSLDPCSIL